MEGFQTLHKVAVVLAWVLSATARLPVFAGDDVGASPIDRVREAQQARIAMIEGVAPSVVCVFDHAQRSGGSGVIIDPDGYGLTNYHVVAGLLDTRRGWGGLNDGQLYELQVLGIDPTGDVAMFRLHGEKPFPFARLGDSDEVVIGDSVIAMGNPFSLSEDYTPSVSMGIVTGVHRYQEGVRGNLTYTDCIQVDAAINPGNSGGPLFNDAGEVVGINGRISVNTRGRFNVGFGYAITSNQIRRFLPAMRAGLLARHGTLQAAVEHVDGVGVVFAEMIRDASAYNAGVRVGDRLIAVDGLPITSPNYFASVLGTYPEGWEVRLAFERMGRATEATAKLEPIEPRLKEPFEVDREVNLTQVKRVLRQYRESAGLSEVGGGASSRKWTVERRAVDPGDGADEAADRFRFVQRGDEPIRMQKMSNGKPTGRIVEFDDHRAVQRARAGAEAYDLSPEVVMVYAVQFIMRHRLLAPVESIDLSDIRHAGGSSVIRPAKDGVEPVSRMVELLEWPVAGHAVATFAFDVQNHWLVRVVVRDTPSGAEATIDLSDHEHMSGVVWPRTMEVRGSGQAYRDTMLELELVP
jgi:S1-C subfamily serine protease